MRPFDIEVSDEVKAPPHHNDTYLQYLQDRSELHVHIIDEDTGDPGNLVVLDGGEGKYALGSVTSSGFKRWGSIYPEEVEPLIDILADIEEVEDRMGGAELAAQQAMDADEVAHEVGRKKGLQEALDILVGDDD